MPKIITTIEIDAPIERVFDLSRSIDFHAFSQKHRNERAIGGKTSGLITLGETVKWRATHFGISQKLSVQITQFNRPFSFRDTMLSGAFKKFDHDHILEQQNGFVKLVDVFEYETPYFIAGKLFDFIILRKYMTNFLRERSLAIKSALESDLWKLYLEN